jgi:hypothetical protein
MSSSNVRGQLRAAFAHDTRFALGVAGSRPFDWQGKLHLQEHAAESIRPLTAETLRRSPAIELR